ncbi:GDYXXLXY domain-containing protein [Vreelandella sp. V005]|uniref:GDYXXLXY domain-containing protein n=1 Tax=Vreelandella sp. V005 TaxID=3459608 RepID=UPI004044F12C
MKLTPKQYRWLVIAAAVVMLSVVNGAIWQKERHLAEGEIVYLELAPVDPRSLIQGDYMALNFALGNQVQSALVQQDEAPQGRPQKARNGAVFVRLDEQRIAHFQRLDNGAALGAKEKRLRYRLRNGQVRFATDAFFFQEGHAEQYESARYGQFRLNTQGELLLVAMYDEALNRLGEMTQ